MPVKRRSSFHHGNLRQALLDASRQLLARRGPEAFSLREVARAAGVSSGAPYSHFATRAELLAALAEDAFTQISSALEQAARAERSPTKRLESIALAYVDFACADPARYRLLYLAETGDRQRFASMHAAAWRAMEQLVRAIAGARPDLARKKRALFSRAAVMWASCHGFAQLAAEGVIANRPELGPQRKLYRAFATAVMTAAMSSGSVRARS